MIRSLCTVLLLAGSAPLLGLQPAVAAPPADIEWKAGVASVVITCPY